MGVELTILTPIYNRKKEIEKLYDSLKKQTNKNFIWLIIDDGSKDNLIETIKQYQNENIIDIRFYRKENGGKHTALNFGINKITTRMTFIVDSDDWLINNAVEIIYETDKKYYNHTNEKLCGYTFLRQYPNGVINGKKFKRNAIIGNYIDIRINKNIDGDKAEVFYTKCLKEYPFPEFEKEKFLGEDVVWIQMANKYKMIYFNKAIYVGDYLKEGLTLNRRKYNIKSLNGSSFRGLIFMNKRCKIKYRIKGALSYIIYGKFANKNLKELFKENQYKLLCAWLYIPANIIFLVWKDKYKDYEKKFK